VRQLSPPFARAADVNLWLQAPPRRRHMATSPQATNLIPMTAAEEIWRGPKIPDSAKGRGSRRDGAGDERRARLRRPWWRRRSDDRAARTTRGVELRSANPDSARKIRKQFV